MGSLRCAAAILILLTLPASCAQQQATEPDDQASLRVGGLAAEVTATPIGLAQGLDPLRDHMYPLASLVAVQVRLHWEGPQNATGPVEAAVSFDARNVDWLAPEGRSPPWLDAPGQETYAWTFTRFGGNQTAFWSFRVPANATEGPLRLPVTLAVRGAAPSSNAKDLVLRVVSRADPVQPSGPFWQDPSFILLVGVAIGLAVGFIAFGRGRLPGKRQGPP